MAANRGPRIPTRDRAKSRSTHHKVGHLLNSFGFTKPSVASGRWGRSQPRKKGELSHLNVVVCPKRFYVMVLCLKHVVLTRTLLEVFNICGSVHHALYWWNKSNKMQLLRFLFAMALLYMFRATISPIIRSTMLYMATGELAHLGCY